MRLRVWAVNAAAKACIALLDAADWLGRLQAKRDGSWAAAQARHPSNPERVKPLPPVDVPDETLARAEVEGFVAMLRQHLPDETLPVRWHAEVAVLKHMLALDNDGVPNE